MKRRLFLKFIILVLIFWRFFTSCNYSTNDNMETNNSIEKNDILRVHFIDVGQGDSTLLQVNGFNVLIDAGPNSASHKLLPYLKGNNVENIDYVIATHPDEDHIGGMDEVIKNFNIGILYAPKLTKDTDTFISMVKALKSKGLKINVALDDIALNLGEDIILNFLAPIEENYEEVNNYSVVTKLTYKNISMLFMGDAENLVEAQLLRDKVDIDTDVIKIGHHGSSSSTSDDFLRVVSPEYAIISCGKNNRYKHPHKETINKLENAKVGIYRTDLLGTIIISSDGNNITTTTMDQAK
ncbi:ComEC/Rec2 family competence protein [Clostridium thermarum]|uniref:ComEC/Rec2 family competence protein n=1 Tax=Clostridium thermarum TaxID=1716543 RepID=UPI001122B5D0|nr:ComEC/Rec2 family competence protein [Clostridium thermarum]